MAGIPEYCQLAATHRGRHEAGRVEVAPEPSVVTRIDTLRVPFAPIIASSNIESTTRNDSLLLSGSVRDDRGLDYVMFTVNGESFRTDGGDELILRPGPESEGTRLDFRVTIPLILGENQITVVAYDRDMPEPHRAVYPLAITRKRPIYQTPLFVGGLSALLLILGGALVISRLLKRRIAFVNKYNPYIAGAPVLNEKMFFGRENLIRRVINTFIIIA